VHVQSGPKNWTCLSVDSLTTVSGRKACDMSKFFECSRETAMNLHSNAFQYSLANVRKSLGLDWSSFFAYPIHYKATLSEIL